MPNKNLNIDLPVVNSTPGPDYALKINDAITKIVDDIEGPITPDEINVNADIDVKSNKLENVKQVNLADLVALIGVGNSGLYSFNGELHYQDKMGNNVQLTSAGALNTAAAGNVGSIGAPTYGSSGVQVLWDGFQSLYEFRSSLTAYAELLLSGLRIANGANRLTVKTSVSTDYTLTLPDKPTVNDSVLTTTSAGNASWSKDLSLDSLSVSGPTTLLNDASGTKFKESAVRKYTYTSYDSIPGPILGLVYPPSVSYYFLGSGSATPDSVKYPLSNFDSSKKIIQTVLRVNTSGSIGSWKIQLIKQGPFGSSVVVNTKTIAVGSDTIITTWNQNLTTDPHWFIVTFPTGTFNRYLYSFRVEASDQ